MSTTQQIYDTNGNCYAMAGKVWTQAEDEILRTHYQTMRKNVLKLLPDRSYDAVTKRVHHLGLDAVVQEQKLSLNDVNRAYIAGIIDGEGYVGLTRRFRPDRITYEYTPKIHIATTNRQLFDWLRLKLDDIKYCTDNKPQTATQKVCYNIVFYSAPSVYALLDSVMEYLIIKHEQAGILSEYCASRIGVSTRAGYTIDPEITWSRMHELNKKGPRVNERQ